MSLPEHRRGDNGRIVRALRSGQPRDKIARDCGYPVAHVRQVEAHHNARTPPSPVRELYEPYPLPSGIRSAPSILEDGKFRLHVDMEWEVVRALHTAAVRRRMEAPALAAALLGLLVEDDLLDAVMDDSA